MADRFENFTVLDSLVDGALVVGLSGDLCYCNEALSKICEIPFRQLSKKKNLGEILKVTPAGILDFEKLKDLEDQSPYEEVTFVSTSGKTGKVQISIQPVLNKAGQKNILIFLHDVTLEEKLQAKYRSELSQKDSKISEITLLLDISNALTGFSDSSTVYRNVAGKLISHGICNSLCHLHYQEGVSRYSMALYGFGNEAKSIEFSRELLEPFALLWENDDFQTLTQKSHPAFFKMFAAKIKIERDTYVRLMPVRTGKFRKGVFLLIMNGPEVKEGNLDLLKSVMSQMSVALEGALFFENSITDDMTKLFNKRYLMTRLNSEVERAKRNVEPLSFIIFDVDHFKKFNDKHGHLTGDLVLKEVARVTKNFCRGYDVAARYGGEEFVLIMLKTDEAGAVLLAERLRSKIEEMTVVSGDAQLKVTVSLGISVLPEQALEADDLIALADKALYFAKRNGRNQLKVYGPDCETTLALSKI